MYLGDVSPSRTREFRRLCDRGLLVSFFFCPPTSEFVLLGHASVSGPVFLLRLVWSVVLVSDLFARLVFCVATFEPIQIAAANRTCHYFVLDVPRAPVEFGGSFSASECIVGMGAKTFCT